MRRSGVFFVAVAAASIVLGGAAGGKHSAVAPGPASGPLLGIVGDVARFKSQTGQESLVKEAFIGWGQGQTFGSQFAGLLPTLGPIPMLHLGTGGRDRTKEAITPGGIASGQGDSFLIALNHGIAAWGKAIYIRPMAEMNSTGNYYSSYTESGQLRDAAHSQASYRKAFARIYVILHGGSESAVNAKLRTLGLPPVRGGELLLNPFPTLRIIWSPLAGGNPRVPGNAPEQYYPGRAYVDVHGGSIYDERLSDTAPWTGLEALYDHARANGKPFSVPEWGMYTVDDPAFVQHMCNFLNAHPATEVAVFYESKPGSIFDLAPKPNSRQAYSRCMIPLAGELPDWAAANAPGGGAQLIDLTLTPRPPSGAPPLDVRFSISARLSVPIVRWELLFGDGSQAGGNGPPPPTVQHSYERAGIYQAMLFVFHAPPFTLKDALFFTAAGVTAGTDPAPLVSFAPTPTSGRAPLKVNFRTDLSPPVRVTSWTLVFGDGRTRTASGTPARFIGHTFATAGTYRVLLILDGPGTRFGATVEITAAGAGGGGGGGGGGAPPTTTTTPAAPVPPATGTATGTVLVNGQPFTSGQIPYNSTVDVTNGRLTLRTDTGTLLVFGDGVFARFRLLRGTDRRRSIVELRLVGGNFSACPTRKKNSAAQTPATTVRRLWGNGRGRFRTRGRYAAATVRGTFWLTADRCGGTFFRSRQGVIGVLDPPRRTEVLVRAGRTYLATP